MAHQGEAGGVRVALAEQIPHEAAGPTEQVGQDAESGFRQYERGDVGEAARSQPVAEARARMR